MARDNFVGARDIIGSVAYVLSFFFSEEVIRLFVVHEKNGQGRNRKLETR